MFQHAQATQGKRETAPESMGRRWAGRPGSLRLTLALLLAISAAVFSVPIFAEPIFYAPSFSTAIYGENVRKLKSSAAPEYPELAKRMNIRGVARVELTIAPDGTVKNVKELGGNPVLVDALKRAVSKWRYEPAEKSTFAEVQFTFGEQ
jgi:TonB family protein